MPGPNTTGTPNTNDYNLGRGIIYLSKVDAVTQLPVGGYRDVGNAPEFKISVAVSTLEHSSSRKGLKVVDRQVTISEAATLSFVLDELNHENLADFTSGIKAQPTNSSVAGYTNSPVVAAGNLALGRWYDLSNTSNTFRSYDVDPTKITVLDTTNVAFVAGTDYTLDSEMGRIFILAASAKAIAAVGAARGIKVTLTADAAANAVDEVQGLTNPPIQYALKFIGENAADDAGPKMEVQVGNITLTADADLSMIGDTFTTLGMKGTANQDVNGDTLKIRTVQQVL